ncbi:MAG: hypothetical protein L3J75_10565 [Methylococcaceae bacterium]|nr:hypothetical protein [Methylococcaceae bacterium]
MLQLKDASIVLSGPEISKKKIHTLLWGNLFSAIKNDNQENIVWGIRKQ